MLLYLLLLCFQRIRMNPETRNLHRATTPEYLEDGTPNVTIPNNVLLQGLQKQKKILEGSSTAVWYLLVVSYMLC